MLGGKPTAAALALQQESIVQALQALTTQVQQGAALAAPVSSAIAPSPAAPRQLAGLLGAPPRGKAAASSVAFGASEEVMPGLLDGESLKEAGAPGGTLTSALLAQSKALTTLVAQIAGGRDPIADLASLSVKGSAARMKLQRELHSRSGGFFLKVQDAARRRMEPTAQLSTSGSCLRFLRARPPRLACALDVLARLGFFSPKNFPFGCLYAHGGLLLL